MTITSRSKVGKILRNPAAAEVLFTAMPEIRSSPHLAQLRVFTLEWIADQTKRDQAWLDQLVVDLAEVPDLAPRGQPFEPPSPRYEGDEVPRGSAECSFDPTAPLWGIAELSFSGPAHGNPFTGVELGATFQHGDRRLVAPGFYDGDG
ncbi:MAG: DUF5060 domain-containing protein, partial [Acidimicrobiales bacterium]